MGSSGETVVHVVDDDEAVRDSLAFLLEGEDFKVHTYASANAFLTVLSPSTHGCIVTNVQMPDMSGIVLLRRLQAMGVVLPVIVITGHADARMSAEAIQCGAIACVMKPLNDDSLLSIIREVSGRAAIQGPRLGRA